MHDVTQSNAEWLTGNEVAVLVPGSPPQYADLVFKTAQTIAGTIEALHLNGDPAAAAMLSHVRLELPQAGLSFSFLRANSELLRGVANGARRRARQKEAYVRRLSSAGQYSFPFLKEPQFVSKERDVNGGASWSDRCSHE